MQPKRLVSVVTPLSILITTVNAIGNCKCQDSKGQYNSLTRECCTYQFTEVYHGDQHHQCSSFSGSLSKSAFEDCCKYLGAGGAFCW
ncbi:hypothetical protein DL98DRAFT_593942 [Cadophora sp. DSE1049]|nr:hypothetical protein DL98DRAFT_593942 [Cadophora sp. DSE1049]